MNAETQYLEIMKEILDNGIEKDDRTGTGTLSLFGKTIYHDYQEGFPLLTTKKMFTKGIVGELIWFLKSTDDPSFLIDNNIHIWDGWMKKRPCNDCDGIGVIPDEFSNTWELEYVDCQPCSGSGDSGLLYLPHTYGLKWRNFDGVDQIENLIEEIKHNPASRRLVVSAWDPRHVASAALTWCHVLFQINVRGPYMDICVYQRSADWLLGVPFNIASYSFLLYMICDQTGYIPGRMIYNFGDCHLYKNHLVQATQQIGRKPFAPPTLAWTHRESIDDYQIDDFAIVNYECWPAIKAEVSV